MRLEEAAEGLGSGGGEATPSRYEKRILGALDRLLQDQTFKASDRNRRFLRFVVEETLHGRSDRIKSYAIAVDVFGRNEKFDAANDPIVRIEATRLRAALAAYYAGPGLHERLRIDLPRGGYVPTFEEMAGAGNASPPEESGPPIESDAGVAQPAGIIAIVRRYPGALALAAVAGLAAFAAGLLAEEERSRSELRPASIILVEAATTVAGGNVETQIARGLTQSLIMSITRFNGLRVIPVANPGQRDAALEQHRTGEPAQSIYDLSTNIRTEGAKLRVWWSLSDALSGEIIWSDMSERQTGSGSTMTIEDEIALGMAERIGSPTGVVSSREIAIQESRPNSDYSCILRARGDRDSYDAEVHGELRDCLERAVAANPNFSEAWAMLAYIYLDEVRNGTNVRVSKEDASQRALDAAEKAVEFAPYSDVAHEVLMAVLYRRGDFPAAENAGRRALELNPGNPEIKAELGHRLFARGRFDEGASLVREAAEQTIFVPLVSHITLALDDYRKHEFPRALNETNKIDVPAFYGSPLLRAAIYGEWGMTEEGRRAVTELLELRPNYASEMREDFRSRHYTEPFIDMVAESLRKAGLAVK